MRVAFLSVILLGCVQVTIPGDTAENTGRTYPGDPRVVPWRASSNDSDDVGLSPTGELELADASSAGDAQNLPQDCDSHCDCPSGWDCINRRCQLGELAILCCAASDCPSGQPCWSALGVAGTCD